MRILSICWIAPNKKTYLFILGDNLANKCVHAATVQNSLQYCSWNINNQCHNSYFKLNKPIIKSSNLCCAEIAIYYYFKPFTYSQDYFCLDSCYQHQCDHHATCYPKGKGDRYPGYDQYKVYLNQYYYCRCNHGYEGNGHVCNKAGIFVTAKLVL